MSHSLTFPEQSKAILFPLPISNESCNELDYLEKREHQFNPDCKCMKCIQSRLKLSNKEYYVTSFNLTIRFSRFPIFIFFSAK